jgi:uncharacterized protein YdaU (DUF1376 family)
MVVEETVSSRGRSHDAWKTSWPPATFPGGLLPNPLPYYPLYPDDFDLSETVSKMSLEAKGLYISMLNLQWRNGSVPSDLTELSRLLHVNIRTLQRVFPECSRCFGANCESGRIANKRLQDERIKAFDKVAKSKKALDARYGRSTPVATDVIPPGVVPHASDSEVPSSDCVEKPEQEKNVEGGLGETRLAVVVPAMGGEFQQIMGMWLSLGIEMSETDTRKCAMLWVALGVADQIAAFRDIEVRYPDWRTRATRHVPRPWNYLGERQWERRAVAPVNAKAMTKGELVNEQAARGFDEWVNSQSR